MIVPPTPKHYPPKSETEGVLSAAVQPPGSTGDEPILQRNNGDEDSDGTSFTDEDDVGDVTQDQIQEEDEEERLIMNGGAGIPIGPVRVNFLFLCILSCSLICPRMAIRDPSCHLFRRRMQVANVSC